MKERLRYYPKPLGLMSPFRPSHPFEFSSLAGHLNAADVVKKDDEGEDETEDASVHPWPPEAAIEPPVVPVNEARDDGDHEQTSCHTDEYEEKSHCRTHDVHSLDRRTEDTAIIPASRRIIA